MALAVARIVELVVIIVVTRIVVVRIVVVRIVVVGIVVVKTIIMILMIPLVEAIVLVVLVAVRVVEKVVKKVVKIIMVVKRRVILLVIISKIHQVSSSLSLSSSLLSFLVHPGGGCNPFWDETFIFNVRNENSITFTLFDKNITGDDRCMGCCNSSITDWIVNGFNGSLNVYNRGKLQGTLIVEANFISTQMKQIPKLRPLSMRKQPPPSRKSSTSLPKVTITVMKGIDIKCGKSLFGNADVYVTLQLGDYVLRTSVCPSGGMNPVWNEDFIFTLKSADRNLSLNLYDKDTTGIDRHMGQCEVDISKWIDNRKNDNNTNDDSEYKNDELQIINRRGKFEGTLVVSAKYFE